MPCSDDQGLERMTGFSGRDGQRRCLYQAASGAASLQGQSADERSGALGNLSEEIFPRAELWPLP